MLGWWCFLKLCINLMGIVWWLLFMSVFIVFFWWRYFRIWLLFCGLFMYCFLLLEGIIEFDGVEWCFCIYWLNWDCCVFCGFFCLVFIKLLMFFCFFRNFRIFWLFFRFGLLEVDGFWLCFLLWFEDWDLKLNFFFFCLLEL